MSRHLTIVFVSIVALALLVASGCNSQASTEERGETGGNNATADGGETDPPPLVANDDGESEPAVVRNDKPSTDEKGNDVAATSTHEPPAIVKSEWKPTPPLAAAIAKLDSNKSPGELISLDGEWLGYLASYPGPIGVKLNIDAGGSSASERMITIVDKEFREHLHKKLYPKQFQYSRQIPYTPMASFAPRKRVGIARQVFREPEGKETIDQEFAAVADMELGWLLFQPERDRSSRAYQLASSTYICTAVPAEGNRPETLVGWFGDNRSGDALFVLTRPKKIDYLMKPVYGSFEFLPGGTSKYRVDDAATLPLFQKMGLPDGYGKPSPFLMSVEKWKSRIADEYPEVKDVERLSTRYSYGLNLFEDDYFKKHFGVSYFDLTEAESATIFYGMGKTFLKGAFDSGGSFGRVRNVQQLVAQREIRRYRDWLLKKLSTLEAFPECGQWLDAQQQMARLQMYPLWPSEKREVDEAFAAARKRLSGDALRLIAAKQISELTGRRGAFALSKFRVDNQQFLELASEADRKEVLQWLELRRDYLASQLAWIKGLQLTKFGDTPADLRKISDWRKEMIDDYAPVIDTAPFALLGDHIRFKRRQIISQNEEDLKARLADSKSTHHVDGFLDRYLSDADDRNFEVGVRLIALADERRKEIDFQTFKSKFSDREWEWREKGEVDLSDGGPTAEEIRLALFREIKLSGGKIIDSHNVEYTYSPISKYGISILVTIDEIEVTKRTQVKGSNSWRCSWRVTKGDAELSRNARDLVGGDNRGFSYVTLIEGMLSSMLNGMSEPSSDVFEATPNGWRSRDIRRRAPGGKLFAGRK